MEKKLRKQQKEFEEKIYQLEKQAVLDKDRSIGIESPMHV